MLAAKRTLALLFIAAIAIAGAAQQRDSANLSLDFPVPAWPADGVIPNELKSHYVFVDAAKNEYVLAYPENLGSPDFEKDGPGQRRISRYPLQRAVEPKVEVTVTQSGNRYRYSYSVSDAPNAKQAIDQFVIVLPDAASASTVKQPAGWFGIIQKGRKFSVANPDWIKVGSAAVFSVSKTEEQVKPGAKKTGFEVESELKPGFTVSYFREAESVDALVQTSGNIPQIVVRNATPPPPAGGAPPAGGGGGGGFGGGQQATGAATAWQPIKEAIDKLLQFEYNSKTVLVLAPKFEGNATNQVIAADFLQGLTAMSRSGAVSADSPFVKTTISELDAYVKAGGSGPLRLSAQPASPAETEVFNAMKVSLRLN